jgi:uncharacterized membrane protein YeaQ/YmgE (transglycosylase-associated protein family)
MSLVDFLMFLLIAGICGTIAQAIVGYSRGGCLVSIALGLIGALLGAWLAKTLGMGEVLDIEIGGKSFPVVWSIIGAVLFVAVLSLVTRRRV